MLSWELTDKWCEKHEQYYRTNDCCDCYGEGGHHDCGEDSCCCLDPEEITHPCGYCKGTGTLVWCPECESEAGAQAFQRNADLMNTLATAAKSEDSIEPSPVIPSQQEGMKKTEEAAGE